jgi:putative N-acetylmannosamine-6-phosphate epimerase
MLKVTFELKDNVNVDEFLEHHKDTKRVKKVSVSGRKKTASKKTNTVAEPMTEYYSKGKQLSVKEFKSRIKKAEQDIKEGKYHTPEQLKSEMESWKKQKGYK